MPCREVEDTGTAFARARTAKGLLCVANFPANTGYAWGFIEEIYRSIADHFAAVGVQTWVAYPVVDAPPASLIGSAARPVELDVRLSTWQSVLSVVNFVRRNDIGTLYLTDQAAWKPAYAALRVAGVRRIVVHDHTSGHRTVPAGLRRLLKRGRGLIRVALADHVIAVSDFVARRKVEVDLVPRERVRRIWNSRTRVEYDADAGRRLRSAFALGPGPIVVCACRATPEKGVAHLMRAFDRYCATLTSGTVRPMLVYFGDGPAMPELRELHRGLRSAQDIILAGYRADADELLAGADVCVVPSVWQEAFGLAVLEPMAHGIPVVASRVGGIPELVIHGETGLLTDPGDETGLEDALRKLLEEPSERRRLGKNGLRRARTHFDRNDALDELIHVLEPGLGIHSPGRCDDRSIAGQVATPTIDERHAGKR